MIKFSEIYTANPVLSAGANDIFAIAVVDGGSPTGYTTAGITKADFLAGISADNMATADLTLTGDRVHDAAGFNLDIVNANEIILSTLGILTLESDGSTEITTSSGDIIIKTFAASNNISMQTANDGALIIPFSANPTADVVAPLFGMVKYNTTSNEVEYYNGSVWGALGGAGNTIYTADDLIGAGRVATLTDDITFKGATTTNVDAVRFENSDNSHNFRWQNGGKLYNSGLISSPNFVTTGITSPSFPLQIEGSAALKIASFKAASAGSGAITIDHTSNNIRWTLTDSTGASVIALRADANASSMSGKLLIGEINTVSSGILHTKNGDVVHEGLTESLLFNLDHSTNAVAIGGVASTPSEAFRVYKGTHSRGFRFDGGGIITTGNLTLNTDVSIVSNDDGNRITLSSGYGVPGNYRIVTATQGAFDVAFHAQLLNSTQALQIGHQTSGNTAVGNSAYGFHTNLGGEGTNYGFRAGMTTPNGSSANSFGAYIDSTVGNNTTETGTHWGAYITQTKGGNVTCDLGDYIGLEIVQGASSNTMVTDSYIGAKIGITHNASTTVTSTIGLQVDMGNSETVATSNLAMDVKGGDVKVNGLTNTNLLWVDYSTDSVGIGVSGTPSAKFHVNGGITLLDITATGNKTVTTFRNGNDGFTRIGFTSTLTSTLGYKHDLIIGQQTANDTAPTQVIKIDTSGNVILSGLPTSAAGLPSAALWNNSGVINITP